MAMKRYKIFGTKYSTEKSFYKWDTEHRYPTFKALDSMEFFCEAESLDDAHLWMMENQPEYAIGCGINCLDNTDFLCDAIPDYYVREYDTEDFKKILAICIEQVKSRKVAA